MITDTRSKILEYITHHGQARVHDLHRTLRISKVAVHKQLKKLLEESVVVRVGKPPLVLYKFPSHEIITKTVETKKLSEYIQRIISNNFLYITPDGKILSGLAGFLYWAQRFQKNKTASDVAEQYAQAITERKKYVTKEGWITATTKLKDTFTEVFVDKLLFQDFYSYPTFGRTKLAKLVMYAKQVGDKTLIDQIAGMAKPVIEKIIKAFDIQAVAYIPPTVPRPLQFMDELEIQLHLSLPEVKLVKVVPGEIPVPQKTLANLEERIINARDSIYLKDTSGPSYENILLIDDVVGSGASFNETAKKLKAAKVGHKNIVAFALVGNIKGYDVVREM